MNSTAPDCAIRVQDVSKSFGRTRALQGVSLSVPRQSIYGLLGPNGAGKTTLFSIAANFLAPDQGNIEVLGVDMRRVSELRGRVSILPQDALFQRSVPILEQLVFFVMLTGVKRPQAEDEVRRTLGLVGLEKYRKRRVGALSHGMIKRLGIAQAFLGDPEVIILDEPTSGLDPKNAAQIRDLIRELRDRASTIVVSSHNLAEIEGLCDQVAILDRGEVKFEGTVREILSAGQALDILLSRRLTEPELKALSKLEFISDITPREEGRYNVTLECASADQAEADRVSTEVIRILLDMNLAIRELREGRSLEEEFLKLTGERKRQDGTASSQ